MCLQSPIQSRCLSPPSPACSVAHPILCSADCTHRCMQHTFTRIRACSRALLAINRIDSRRSRFQGGCMVAFSTTYESGTFPIPQRRPRAGTPTSRRRRSVRVRAVRADISTRGWGFSVYTYARAHLEAISHVRALLLRITLFCRKKLIQLKI